MPRIIADGQPAGAGGGVVTGDISLRSPVSEDISGIAVPSDGTLGTTSIPTLDHDGAGSTEEGQKVIFVVPDDYDSGDLSLKITYAMSTSSANDIRVSTKAAIIDVSAGTVDTASYPKTFQTVTPPATADEPTRESFLSVSAGDFTGGDTIEFQVTRNPGDALDTHLGDWQVISYEISYTGQISTRENVQDIQLFLDTDETAPSSGTKDGFDTIDFSASTDNEQKFECIVPENWDGFSDMHVRFTYAMGDAAGGVVALATEVDIADVSGGSTTSLSATTLDLPVSGDTNWHRSVVVRTIPATSIGIGDSISVKIARRAGTDADDTATGTWRITGATVDTGVGPKTGFSSVTITEGYLFAHDFEVQTGTPTGEQDSPDFSGDFENYMKMTGNGAGEQIDVSFQGRLASTQSSITSIKIPIKGSVTSAQYVLKVYVDNSSPSTPAYQSNGGSPSNSQTSRTVSTLTNGDLSKQPIFTGGYEGRYFVVVEAYLDSGEVLYVGRPFVTQE